MAENGKISDREAIYLKVKSDGSYGGAGSGDAIYSHSAHGRTQYVADAILVQTGIEIVTESGFDESTGIGYWEVAYNGPGAPFGGLIVSGSGFQAASIEAIPKDYLLYGLNGGGFKERWAAIDIWVNGAFYLTLSSSGIDLNSGGTGPNYVPLIGIPLELSGGVTLARGGDSPPPPNLCDPSAGTPIVWSGVMTGGPIECGWQFKDRGDSISALPVTIKLGSPPRFPTGTGCTGYGLAGIVDATSTWGAAINCVSSADFSYTYEGREGLSTDITAVCGDGSRTHVGVFPLICHDPCTGTDIQGYRDKYKTETHGYAQGGGVLLVPDLEKTINRWNSDYRDLWGRIIFPETHVSTGRTCTDDGVTVSATRTTVVHPAVSQILSDVGNLVHPLEDIFRYRSFAPTAAGVDVHHDTTWTFHGTYDEAPCPCPPPGVPPISTYCPSGEVLPFYECNMLGPAEVDHHHSETVTSFFPSYVGPAPGNYQDHAVDLPRYLGTWRAPHWGVGSYYKDWEIDGSPVDPEIYWQVIEEKHLDHPALPDSERRNTRNSKVSEMVWFENAWAYFQDTFFAGMRWPFVSRFKVKSPTIPASIQLDSTCSSEVVLTDCTGAFGADMVLTPSAADIVVEIPVASWTRKPFLYGHPAKQLGATWSLTNVDQVKVYLVGADGTKVLVTDNVQGAFNKPLSGTSKYAGTWEIDNGAEIISGVSDTGADVHAGGDSAGMMSDPERTVASQLGPTRTYKTIRYEIKPTNPANPVTIHYPTFYAQTTHPVVVWENGKIAAMMWPDGPLIRWGQNFYYDSVLGLLNPPIISGLGIPNSAIDEKCWLRQVFEGKAHDDGLAAECVADYDPFEVQSIAAVDKLSKSFPLPKGSDEVLRWAEVNSPAEVPPMDCYPVRKRNTANWAADGAYALEAWDMAVEPRYYICAGTTPIELQTLAGVDWLTTAFAVPGYTIAKHAHPLDETEHATFHVVRTGVYWAKASPWHGATIIIGIESHGKLLALISRGDGRIYRLTASDTETLLGKASQVEYTFWTDEPIYGSVADNGDLARLPSGKIVALLVVGGDAKLGIVPDEGGALLVPVSDGAATDGALVGRGDNTLLVYRLDAGTIKGTLRNGSDPLDIIAGPWDTNLTGFSADAVLDATPGKVAGNKPSVILSVIDGGTISTYVSTDSKNFS